MAFAGRLLILFACCAVYAFVGGVVGIASGFIVTKLLGFVIGADLAFTAGAQLAVGGWALLLAGTAVVAYLRSPLGDRRPGGHARSTEGES